MYIRKCIKFLFLLWLVFLVFGVWFYRFANRRWPHPLPETDVRSRFVKPWRFVVYILLMPLALTCSLAVLLVWAADAGIIPNF